MELASLKRRASMPCALHTQCNRAVVFRQTAVSRHNQLTMPIVYFSLCYNMYSLVFLNFRFSSFTSHHLNVFSLRPGSDV